MKTGERIRSASVLFLIATAVAWLCSPGAVSAAGVVVLGMEDAEAFSASADIRPLVIEEKEGVKALRMGFKCEGKGTVSVTHRFETLQDWTGYGTLKFKLNPRSSSRSSHFQVLLYDASHNVLLLRRYLSASHYQQWQEVSWDFGRARVYKGDTFDFSRVRLIIFSAWKDHYGHSEGVEVDYWIGEVRRERALDKTGLGASPARSAPRLDGQLDDDCWKGAHIAEQFYLQGEGGLPRSQTSVRVLWDDENIYFALRARHELLEVAQQRLDDFRASVTDRDGGVWRDDSLEIFLAPAANPEEYLHFAVNALGTRYDGRQRDSSWDGEWEASCKIHDGYWTAEIAIPWDTLGIVPHPGSYLLANFFRNDPHNRQHSGWSPVEQTHHTPSAFGYIQLLKSEPDFAVSGGLMPEMQLGENVINPILTGITGGRAAVRLAVTQEGETEEHRWMFSVPSGAVKTIEIPVTVSSSGEIAVVYSIVDAGRDNMYYQSPRHVFDSEAVAGISVAVKGEAEVFHDGVSLGKGRNRGFDTFLRTGVNIIAMEADHPVEAAILSGEAPPDAAGWKQSREAPEGWMLPCFDDSGWETARVYRGRLDPAAGRFFRKVIAAGSTKLRALSNTEHVHLLTGAAQHMPFFVSSPVERAIRGARFVMVLPPGVEWIEWGDKSPPEAMGAYMGYEVSSERVGRETWSRVELKWEQLEPLEWTERTRPNIGMVIRAVNPEPAERRMKFWVEGEEGSVRELAEDIQLTVHPSYTARRPEKVELQLWHSFHAARYGPEELGHLMDAWKTAGFNSYAERTYNAGLYNPLLKERGFKIVAEWIRQWGHMRTAENRFIGYDGKPSPYIRLCPSRLVGKDRDEAVSALAEYVKGSSEVLPDGFVWDLEMGPRAVCYCQRCLNKFSEEYNISRELTTNRVLDEWTYENPLPGYSEEWEDFWCRQWAGVASVYNDGFKRANLRGEMYVYSAYQTPENRTRYYIDWNYVEPYVDIAMCGYGWRQKSLDDTIAAVKGKPLLGGVLHYMPVRNHNLHLSGINLLMAGATGLLQYTWAPMDGLDYLRLARAATFIADNEEFFLRGVRASEGLSGPPAGVSRALRKGNELLVVLVNSSPRARTFSLGVRGASGDFVEYGGDGLLEESSLKAEKASVTVGPHGFAAFTGRIEL